MRSEESRIAAQWSSYASTLAQTVARQSLSLIGQGEVTRHPSMLHYLAENTVKGQQKVSLQITDPAGNVIAEAGDSGADSITAAAPITSRLQYEGKVIVNIARSLIQQDIKAMRLKTAALASGLALCLLLATFLFLQRTLSPLRQLLADVEIVLDKDLGHRAAARDQDETGRLAVAFNRLTEELSRTMVLKDYGDNIIKSMIDTLIVVNLDSTIRTVNQATLDLLGYRADELIGKTVRILFADVGTVYIETWLEYLNREEVISNIEETYLARDGRKIPVLLSASAMRDGKGVLQGIVYVAQDITQRKIAEETIQQSEERYRNLVLTVPDIIYSTSITDGTILSLNPAFERITGWQCPEWTGKLLLDIIHPEDRRIAKDTFSKISRGQPAPNHEMRLRTRSGEYLDCEFTSAPQFKNGEVVAEFGIIRNITDRKKAEKEKELLTRKLLQADKMAAVGQLAGGVAHEINNPLGVILGFAQSLLLKAGNEGAMLLPLRSIEREAKRCKNLVHDLLTFSRVGRTEKEMGELNDVINGALTLIEAQANFKSIRLVREFAADIPEISLNRNQIQQVIVNLCNNAIDAMRLDGVLTIRTLLRNERAEIQVQDTGMGIPREIQSKIFEPFFTTKEVGKGTGLGLSLVYEIVQRHQGTIDVESETGKGTLFTVTLPLA